VSALENSFCLGPKCLEFLDLFRREMLLFVEPAHGLLEALVALGTIEPSIFNPAIL